MTPMTLFLFVIALAILAFATRPLWTTPAVAPPKPVLRRASTPVPPPRKALPPLEMTFPLDNPDLELLQWEPDATTAEPEAVLHALSPLRQKLRDRYIAARFPGVARASADLEDDERVIKAVRLYFGEQKYDRAEELLVLAIGQAVHAKALRLAQLELAFLRRDAPRFTVLANDFRRAHPDSPEWLEVARLGRALAPAESMLFGDAQDAHAHDQYGPWPDMPNWLKASWDLTAEVRGADFHREMARARTPAVPASHRNAA